MRTINDWITENFLPSEREQKLGELQQIILSDRASEVGVTMPKIAEIKRSETLGVWESIKERFVCSNCGAEEITDSYSYCPNCGIKINFIE